MRRVIFLAAILIAAPCYAQQFADCPGYREQIDRIARGTQADAEDAVNELTDVGSTTLCFAQFVAGDAPSMDSVFVNFVKRFEGSRSDKEASAAAGATSATSVVSQGPAAKVLSAAVEYGAITRSVDGQVITLRGNAAGLPSALVRKSIFPYCAEGNASSEFCVGSSILSVLRRISFSVSFDTARGTQTTGTPAAPSSGTGAQPVTFTAQRDQISAASARVELWNRRDVTSKDFQDLWVEKVGPAMAASSTELRQTGAALVAAVRAADLADTYNAWRLKSNGSILAARPDRTRVVDTLRAALEELVIEVRAKHPELAVRAAAAVQSYSRYFLAEDDLIASLSKKNVLALEYSGSQPVGQVGTSNVRLIMDLPLTTRTKMVLNGAATFYDSLPANSPASVTHYRDAQFGLELDHGLGEQSIVGPAMISFALYYQYQHTPPLLEIDPLNPIPGIEFAGLPANARTVFTEKGDIWLGQAKLSLTPPGSSIKVPLSLTYSNRTELVDKPTWRGQVGLAYDLDSLLGALK